MSLIKPVKPVPQQTRRRGVNDVEASQSEKLTKAEIGIVASAGAGGLVLLTLLAWLVLPLSGNILPFVVAGAFPLFTLIAIVYQAVVYRRQWNVMQKALGQTDKVIGNMQAQLIESEKERIILKETLSATQELVKHTERGIEITERNARYAQRAYVTVTERKIVNDQAFYLLIENSGNTPATEVAVNAITHVGFTPEQLPINVTLKGYTHIGLLAPHSRYELVVPLEGSVSEADQGYFDDPNQQFDWWCTGTIVYQDIFQLGLSTYHETNFCFYQDRSRGKVQAWVSGNSMKEYTPSAAYPENIPDPD